MSAFIDAHRERFGVEPVCRVLGVSASAYYQRASGQRSAVGLTPTATLGNTVLSPRSLRTWRLVRMGASVRSSPVTLGEHVTDEQYGAAPTTDGTA